MRIWDSHDLLCLVAPRSAGDNSPRDERHCRPDCRALPRIGLWTEPKADAEGAWRRRNGSLSVTR